jgi:hypothetical protein
MIEVLHIQEWVKAREKKIISGLTDVQEHYIMGGGQSFVCELKFVIYPTKNIAKDDRSTEHKRLD